MEHTDTRLWHGGPTIRTTGWAARLPEEPAQAGADDGLCADLDAPGATAARFGWPVLTPGGDKTLAAEVLDVVRSMVGRAEEAGARIRVEIDPHAGECPAAALGTIVFGMLRRALDACAWVTTHHCVPALDADRCNVTLVVRIDGRLLRVHVLDEAGCWSVPSADAALGLARATVESLGGTLVVGSVPFGTDTLVSAEIPLGRAFGPGIISAEHAA